LTAGSLLWAALQIHPLEQTWLGVKLVLLVVYIGLGTMALQRARTTRARVAWTLASLACFGFMVSVALAHDPLGVFAALR
ncbi:MAG: SirB2 family protein, partial [Rhodoferax sp.]|nr:SirB2 family protein [Rhodoferax sp.]